MVFANTFDMVQGKFYTLVVNNFTNTGVGFGVEWGGTGEFARPESNFGIYPQAV